MTDSVRFLEKSNRLLLSKELNEKDKNLKSQVVITSKNEEKTPNKNIWQKNGLFMNIRSNFNIHKKDFSENTLVYINRGQILIAKKELVIYNDDFGQVIPLQNPPADLNKYICKENETKMLLPLYDTANGEFKRIKKTLVYIILRGDKDETFFNYGYSEEYASILYSYYNSNNSQNITHKPMSREGILNSC